SALGLAFLALMILILPALAYWLFLLLFGEGAWPAETTRPETDRDGTPTRETSDAETAERAFGQLEQATKLEIMGQIPEAMAAYEKIVRSFPDTQASRDAQKSVANL